MSVSMCLQAEIAELHSLVESLTRKNRHLTEELSESTRAQEAAHTQLLTLQVRRQMSSNWSMC